MTYHAHPGRHSANPLRILAAKRNPSFASVFIPEPALEFANRHSLVDPKVGLGIYGPIDRTGVRRSVIRLGLIATGPLIDKVRQWMGRCGSTVQPFRRLLRHGQLITTRADSEVVPPFPGLRQVFDADFVLNENLIETLPGTIIAELQSIPLYEPRVTHLASVVGKHLTVLTEKGVAPDVVIVALPTVIRTLCTVPSKHRRRGKRGRTLADMVRSSLAKDHAVGQLNLIDVARTHSVSSEEPERESIVLHSAIKLRGMRANLTTQLLWEGTLDGIGVEDDATCAWNIWASIYYKATNELWRPTGLTPNTCFVGVSFYKDRHDDRLRCCVAQAFSDRGEGLVLRSEPFTWYHDFEKTPHLSRSQAAEVLGNALRAYMDHLRIQPGRVVIHKWQRFWPEERAGFLEALDQVGVRSHDFVAFGSRGIRFYRAGIEPPLRGTLIPLGTNGGLLFTRGYVPFLRKYPGMRVPRPLEIVEHFGESSLTRVAQEIVALTKLDWNTTMFAAKEPITTAFAADVGQILSEVPTGVQPQRAYRFYM
jgi:hypothetical protein